jgi:beta-xylosidase
MRWRAAAVAAFGLMSIAADAAPARTAWNAPHARNPILPGYFADPSILHDRGEWFVYATIDPWGGDRLGLWRSRDFRDWTFSTPNWPTKAAATSPTSNGSKVWAPSVVRGRDGRYWMYVSVGSEVWVGVADRPQGPWRDAHGGTPLIPGNARPGYHMIDAEAFVDDDGQAYLYWGSGLHWVNGRCFVVRLKPDMVSFDGEPRDVTPAHYFEGPFLFKANGLYFLTYSFGNTTSDTYQVRYAVGRSPMGPFTEPVDAPILSTDRAASIISPGHHAVFRAGGGTFILYHRQSLPFPRGDEAVLRQVAVDRLIVRGDRLMRVAASHAGADVPGAAAHRAPGRPIRLSGSGTPDPAAWAGDDNYATAWRPRPGASATLTADLGRVTAIGASELRPAMADTPFHLAVEASSDAIRWRTIMADRTLRGSPVTIPPAGAARFVRLRFATPVPILEWRFPPAAKRDTDMKGHAR